MKTLKSFAFHLMAGLLLFLVITGLIFGLGTLFDGGYEVISFYIIIGLPVGYALFIFLTTYYNWKVSTIQDLLTGFLTFAANGEIEPLYHDTLQNLELGKVLNSSITTLIGTAITVIIKLISDRIIDLFKVEKKEQRLKIYYCQQYLRKHAGPR